MLQRGVATNRCCVHPLIVLSRLAQAMTGEQDVAQQELQLRGILARGLTLNARGVNVCRTLDGGGPLLDERPQNVCSHGHVPSFLEEEARRDSVVLPRQLGQNLMTSPSAKRAVAMADGMHLWRQRARGHGGQRGH